MLLDHGPYCFTSTEVRWLIRAGQGGKGTKEGRLDGGYRPKKTGEAVDLRQNDGSVKAVSPRHCPATSALRNCCFNCRAWAESQYVVVVDRFYIALFSALEKTRCDVIMDE